MAKYKPYLLGSVLGLLYGVLARLIGGSVSFFLFSCAFILLVPLVMGYLSVLSLTGATWWEKLWVPCIPWLLAVGMAWLVGAEGTICIVLATPVALLASIIGGFLAPTELGQSRPMLPILVLLPAVVAPIEDRIELAPEVRAVRNEIEIAAPPEVVWEHIREVRTISRAEHGDSFFNAIGFPRPLQAKLAGSGVGAVREASFEGGVLFLERVTAWQERERLAFDIRANTADIPPTTLDPHVVVGSRYFDVLDGEYLLEVARPGVTRIQLTSHHRLTTTLEPYAHLWSDAILSSVQERILRVIRSRCERS
ncbi:MAG TPA: hypothetical protein VJU61_13955 [Polyangiaceae bacterium]|nr:hypothetical protein [Polyangiaceae bacterium]